jgi:hypothetical protein
MNSSEDINLDRRLNDGDSQIPVSETANPMVATETGSTAAVNPAPAVTFGANAAAPKGAPEPQAIAPKIPSPASKSKPAIEEPAARLNLIPFVRGEHVEEAPAGASYWRGAFEKRLQIGAIAAGVVVMGVVGAASLSYKAQQDQVLVAQNTETQNLAETVKSLKARLSAIDASKHEDILELRKSVADLKSALAASRDSNAILAQINARAERVEHDEDARIEKLSERVDRDAAAHNLELTARLEKLEKKAAAPVVAALAPPPAAAPVPVPVPAPGPAALPKQPATLPPVATNISKETTGSIAPQTPIRGWAVREVRGNVAILQGPNGFRQVGPGDTLPGIGRIERIERRATGWAVVTNEGIINGGYVGNGYRAGGFGPSYGGYGPYEGEF